ncbi:MAG: hypothetical protein R3326_07835 [Gemmatimonadota bacterium]|nr:hypothetical protein [Gemmatimonadota bacterium]
MADPPRVHVLIDDLFFRSKVEATARALDVAVHFAKSADDLSDRLAGDPDAIVLVDLNHPADPVAAIRALKDDSPSPRVVAFGSHVDTERLKAARDAGADRVLARSAFTDRLAEILRGESR